MTITFPLQLPAFPDAAAVTISPLHTVAILDAPHSLKQQVQRFDGQLWQADITLRLMPRATAAPWTAFLLAMNGRAGTVLLGDPATTAPLGVATGTPLVDGASQAGGTLATKGWSASVTGILKAGDYIQLGAGAATRLHQVIEDADSDSGGLASLTIWPDLRDSPADGAAVVTQAPKGTFRLAANDNGWSTDNRGLYGVTLSLIEAVDG